MKCQSLKKIDVSLEMHGFEAVPDCEMGKSRQAESNIREGKH